MQKLDAKQIISVINPKNLPRLAKIEIFDTLDSTNTYLLNQSASALSGWVCFAEEQTQGKGRLGRQWVANPGSDLCCSVLWNFSKQNISHLSLAVGVMVANALQRYGLQDVQLKWPNDIFFAGRKLGGILVERKGPSVVIGIGLNVSQKNESLNAISLAEILTSVLDRNFLAGLLVNELLTQLPIYEENEFEFFLEEWKKRDAYFGKEITVKTSQQIYSGVMHGINEAGELLLLDENNHVKNFICGEVTVRLRDY